MKNTFFIKYNLMFKIFKFILMIYKYNYDKNNKIKIFKYKNFEIYK